MKGRTRRTDRTSITIDVKVYKRLTQQFQGHESWNSMFNRILDEREKYKLMERARVD